MIGVDRKWLTGAQSVRLRSVVDADWHFAVGCGKGIYHDDQDIFHNHCCPCPGAWCRFCTGSGTGSCQLWNGNFGFNSAYGALVRCSTIGIGHNFLVRPGRLVGILAQRVYRHHYRQRGRVDCRCYGDHSRYAECNGMGCCFNLSLWSSGVGLLRDDAIASAIVALKLNIVVLQGRMATCPRSSGFE